MAVARASSGEIPETLITTAIVTSYGSVGGRFSSELSSLGSNFIGHLVIVPQPIPNLPKLCELGNGNLFANSTDMPPAAECRSELVPNILDFKVATYCSVMQVANFLQCHPLRPFGTDVAYVDNTSPRYL